MFTDNFSKNYNKNNEIGYSLLLDVKYPFYLQPLHKHMTFLQQKGNR